MNVIIALLVGALMALPTIVLWFVLEVASQIDE